MQSVDRCWPILTIDTKPTAYLLVKRVVDLVGGLILLAALAPIILGCALLTRLESPGPLFVGHHGIGLGGRRFTFYRLRTHASGSGTASQQDDDDAWCGECSETPRAHCSPLGRFLQRYGIDELPQLWNVVRGDMSLVGPRPGRPGEVLHYQNPHLHRLAVKPGITGLWQVRCTRHTSLSGMIEVDLEYIQHRSLRLDFELLLRTVFVLFGGTRRWV